MKTHALKLLIMALTAMALIGHGGGSCEDICSLRDAESVSFHVVGTCGPAGRVTLTTTAGECGLEISGDDVGVPRSGDVGSIRSGGWRTADAQLSCSTFRIDSSDDQRFHMRCVAQGEERCEAFFIDTQQQCDVGACVVNTCEAGFKLDLAAGECCPRCVECSGCVPPRPEPDAAQPEPDAAIEVMPAVCAAGRAEYQMFYAQVIAGRDRCTTDGECEVTAVHNECASHCGLVVNEDVFDGAACDGGDCIDVEDALDDYADDACAYCDTPLPCALDVLATARCVEGICERVP